MAFNGNTYRANKYRRKAMEEIKAARAMRDRIKLGVPVAGFDYPERVLMFAKLACGSRTIARTYRELAAMGRR